MLRLTKISQIERCMTSISLSPKFQIVIPRDLRRALSLVPGQRLEVRLKGDRIELIPVLPMTAMRGLFPGIATTVENDDTGLEGARP